MVNLNDQPTITPLVYQSSSSSSSSDEYDDEHTIDMPLQRSSGWSSFAPLFLPSPSRRPLPVPEPPRLTSERSSSPPIFDDGYRQSRPGEAVTRQEEEERSPRTGISVDGDKIIEVVVGPAPPDPRFNYTQRTFPLPASLLARHSSYFYNALSTAFHPDKIELPNADARMFQNWIDFVHSSIYSLNTNTPGYHPVPSHASAYMLGSFLGSTPFRTAALRALHAIFTPYSHQPQYPPTPIRPSDIEWVCQNAEPGSNLKTLFFDALTSHWSQSDIINIGYAMDVDGESVSWTDVYNGYADFRRSLVESLRVVDGRRGALLGGVGEYLSGRVGGDGKESGGGTGGEGRVKGEDFRVREKEGDGGKEDGYDGDEERQKKKTPKIRLKLRKPPPEAKRKGDESEQKQEERTSATGPEDDQGDQYVTEAEV